MTTPPTPEEAEGTIANATVQPDRGLRAEVARIQLAGLWFGDDLARLSLAELRGEVAVLRRDVVVVHGARKAHEVTALMHRLPGRYDERRSLEREHELLGRCLPWVGDRESAAASEQVTE